MRFDACMYFYNIEKWISLNTVSQYTISFSF